MKSIQATLKNAKWLALSTFFILGCSKTEDPGTPLPTISAAFTCTPNTGTAPLQVTCTCNNTAGITNYDWSLNGGTIGANSTLSYTFDRSGSYVVVLKVKGKEGTTTKSTEVERQATQTIAVTTPRVQATISASVVTDDIAQPTATVRLTGTLANARSAKINWGDGSSPDVVTNGNISVTHAYARTDADRNYNIILEAQDADNANVFSNQVSVTIKARLARPEAAFDILTVGNRAPLYLNATNKSTGGGTSEWTITRPDNTRFTVTTTDLSKVELLTGGTYRIALKVTNATGSSTTPERTITLTNPYRVMTANSWTLPEAPLTKSATAPWDRDNGRPDFYVFMQNLRSAGAGSTVLNFIYGIAYTDVNPPHLTDRGFVNNANTATFDRGYIVEIGVADNFNFDGAGEDGEVTYNIDRNDVLFRVRDFDMLKFWLEKGTSASNTIELSGTYTNGSFSAPYRCAIRVVFSD